MPQQLNPDIIRYYRKRISHLQERINALWNHVRSIDDFASSQSNIPMSPQYQNQFMNTVRKMEADAKREMRRLGNAMEDLKRKVEQWKMQRP